MDSSGWFWGNAYVNHAGSVRVWHAESTLSGLFVMFFGLILVQQMFLSEVCVTKTLLIYQYVCYNLGLYFILFIYFDRFKKNDIKAEW